MHQAKNYVCEDVCEDVPKKVAWTEAMRPAAGCAGNTLLPRAKLRMPEKPASRDEEQRRDHVSTFLEATWVALVVAALVRGVNGWRLSVKSLPSL